MPYQELIGCLPELSPKGDFYESRNIGVILQSIFVILATPPGSRVWQPEFGCNITKLLFSLETEDVLNEAKQEVRYALERWEPRIRVLDVQSEFIGDRFNKGISVIVKFNYADRDYTYTFPVMENLDMLSQSLYSLKTVKEERVVE
jgi:hypothetical protein